jgi:hypothetical protein
MNKKWMLVTAVAVVGTMAQAQSGWTRPKGDVFAKLDGMTFQSDRYFNPDGKRITTNTYRQQAVLLYAEYGLADRLALHLNFPLVRFNSFNISKPVAGFGDARIELKYALLKGKFPVSVSVAPEFPTGAKNLFSQSKVNAFEKINLPTGDGEFNVWTTVAVSHSFHPKPAYASLYAAYNKRTRYQGQTFQDQLQAGAEVGYKVKKKLWLNARLTMLTGLGPQPVVADFIRGNGTYFTSYAFQGMWELGKHWGISAQYLNYTNLLVKAKNLYTGGQVSLGVVYQRRR